jgi:hypothetical protein
MQYQSLLALALASLVSAGMPFTVNLLTQVEDFSVSFLQLPEQVPISYSNATIKHVYHDGGLYSVIGSLTFNETYQVQPYHLESDQWSVDVSPRTLLNRQGEATLLICRSTALFILPARRSISIWLS